MTKQEKAKLVGRDPAMGRVSFKTGAILTKKDRKRNRNSKDARRELRKQIRNED